MSAASDFAKLRQLPAAGAVSYMRGRRDLTVTTNWQDLWQEEHAHQFTISRLTRLDLLQSIQTSLQRSVDGDLSRRDWMRDTERLLSEAGWWGKKQVLDPATGKIVTTTFDPARLKLIYDTNLRQAYAAGQWDRVWAARLTHPYIRYVTMDDERVRPAHRAWHNLVLPVEHEFWSTHWPPNGWRCRCRVVAISRRDYRSGQSPTGARLNTQTPPGATREHINRRTGEITAVPVGVDPGFGYNAGQARQRVLEQIQQSKLAAADPRLAAAARRDGLTLESAAATFYERARLNPRAKQPYLALAPASSDTVERARRIGIELEGKTVGLDHDGVRHVLTHSIARESLRGQVPLSPSDVALFPKLLAMATLAPGVPPFAPDGARLMTGRIVLEGFVYDLVVKVRRASIVLLTMYKRAE